MKKIISFILFFIVVFSFCSCGKKDVTIKFQDTADKLIEKIQDNKDISKLKEEIGKLETEVLEKIEKASDEEKDQYDMQQISLYFLKEAVENYEKSETDAERENAVNDIETAKKMWSAQIE